MIHIYFYIKKTDFFILREMRFILKKKFLNLKLKQKIKPKLNQN